MLRFLKGTFEPSDGYALQDFEACTVGNIDDSPFIFIGETDANGCLFEAATFEPRT